MYFDDTEIQHYDLQLNDNEIHITSVEVYNCYVVDKVFEDFDGIEDEMLEKYKESWGQFTGDQLVEMKESLSEHLSKNYVSQEDKPEAKGEYDVDIKTMPDRDNLLRFSGAHNRLVPKKQ